MSKTIKLVLSALINAAIFGVAGYQALLQQVADNPEAVISNNAIVVVLIGALLALLKDLQAALMDYSAPGGGSSNNQFGYLEPAFGYFLAALSVLALVAACSSTPQPNQLRGFLIDQSVPLGERIDRAEKAGFIDNDTEDAMLNALIDANNIIADGVVIPERCPEVSTPAECRQVIIDAVETVLLNLSEDQTNERGATSHYSSDRTFKPRSSDVAAISRTC